MTKTQIEEYLLRLEHKLLIEAERQKIQLNREWATSFPNESAVYLFREDGEICYVGETGSLKGRMTDILNTKNHTVRRNLGNAHYSKLPNYEKASARKSFSDDIEQLLNERLINHMTVSYILVDLGRKELEERLFDKLKPKYSIKGKRGKSKAYSKLDKQKKHRNAYERWTEIDDEKLELNYCEGKSITELSDIFGRNNGAIKSRIKKLELKEKYGS